MKTLQAILRRSNYRQAVCIDLVSVLFLIGALVMLLVACSPGTTAPPVARNGKLYGDSIMRAFPVAEMMMYLPAGSSAGNVGVDGQTLRQAELGEYAQSGKSFATDMAAATGVDSIDYVVAAWGTNDANRDRMPPEVFVQTLARMRASAPGKVFIVETAGPISVPEPAQSLVAEYTRLTKEAAVKNNWFVCDTAAEVVRLFPGWFADVGIKLDGLHPSGSIQSAKAVVLAKCILEATK
jgi:hypothetical protein